MTSKHGTYFGAGDTQGVPNESLMPETILKLGQAAGIIFRNGGSHRVIIGKDPRRSGYMIEYLLTGAFTSAGMHPLLTGPLPTPAVAMLTSSMRAALGVMISGSHNPYEYNGIKLFGPEGHALSKEQECEIDRLMNSDLSEKLAREASIGPAKRIDEAQGRYTEFVKRTLPRNVNLEGLRIVIDCANGAAYEVAPQALEELGAEVFAINNKPDGLNINRHCGFTTPDVLSAEVYRVRADIGFAFDGDGERVLVLDENRKRFDQKVIAGYTKAGDGLITALRILAAMKNKGQRASEVGYRS